jgi:hypothetical protein
MKSSCLLQTSRGYLPPRTQNSKLRHSLTVTSSQSQSQSQSHIVTDGQLVSKSWCRAPSGIHDQIFITVLFLWGTLSEEKTSLSFVYAAGPCQRSLSRVRIPWDSQPYLTVSDLGLPFSLPPTTRSVTVEVFDPASTRVNI